MSAAATLPGWHGKLPSLGDFASRRLTPDFLAVWDTWLAQGMQQLRQNDPAGWLDAYLASPTRRFLLMPGAMPGGMADLLPGGMADLLPGGMAGVLPGAMADHSTVEPGPPAWAGVLMPSVDRVGRYFPFTIVQSLHRLPASPQQMHALWRRLGQLDELAADALHDDWPVDRLEAELAQLAGVGDAALAEMFNPASPATPTPTPAAAAAAAWPPSAGTLLALALAPGVDIAQHIDAQAQALWQQRAHGLAYWYASTDLLAPSLWVSRGLPASAAALLGATI